MKRFIFTLLIWSCSVPAMIFMEESDPEFNKIALNGGVPANATGVYANNGWQWQALYGGLRPATVVSPTQLLTAKHFDISGTTTSVTYRGNSYTITGRTSVADLWLVTVDTSTYGDFTSFAPIYSGSDELFHELVVFGNGFNRGAAVTVGGDLKGWQYGNSRGYRWGTNAVSGFEDWSVAGDEKMLYATFTNVGTHADPVGQTTYEAHMTNGDSGGGVFIKEDGLWKLAGINYSVDAYFSYDNDGPAFPAALFDVGGLYYNGGGSYPTPWPLFTDQPNDIPTSFYSTRLSSYSDWFAANLVLPVPEPASLSVLLIGVFLISKRRPLKKSVREG